MTAVLPSRGGSPYFIVNNLAQSIMTKGGPLFRTTHPYFIIKRFLQLNSPTRYSLLTPIHTATPQLD
jgi:hypothetical protein